MTGDEGNGVAARRPGESDAGDGGRPNGVTGNRASLIPFSSSYNRVSGGPATAHSLHQLRA